ncbi:hypothetical protein BKA62DRAFT_689191 [Auriculariales sp. MPI-PUGE-AT-0066]|nr:hypothetical protein BKA62DRAFT_689191 [Auriculariales sp. MPI-PUGE-AT-0066]
MSSITLVNLLWAGCGLYAVARSLILAENSAIFPSRTSLAVKRTSDCQLARTMALFYTSPAATFRASTSNAVSWFAIA